MGRERNEQEGVDSGKGTRENGSTLKHTMLMHTSTHSCIIYTNRHTDTRTNTQTQKDAHTEVVPI